MKPGFPNPLPLGQRSGFKRGDRVRKRSGTIENAEVMATFVGVTGKTFVVITYLPPGRTEMLYRVVKEHQLERIT